MKSYKTAWKHIRRSPYQALAAVLIMLLTFLSISVFTFLVLGSSKVISYFESRPRVTAFFKDEAKQADVDALVSMLKQGDKVSSIRYVSKEEALKIYRDMNKDNPLLLDLVTADVLPASLDISTNRIEDLTSVSDVLKNSPLVDKVIYQKDLVATLTTWTSAVRKIGVVIIAVLASVSIFIMATIIGFKISQKREEIEIMRLLSATKWYVRWPFILEGVFYGVTGAILGWLIASAGLVYATPFLKEFMHGIPLLPVSWIFLLELLIAELLVAVFLGWFSSFLAVLRYLK